MAWEKNTRGKPRFVIKERIHGKVMSRPFRTEADARAYQEAKQAKLRAIREELEDEMVIERAMEAMEKMIDIVIEQTLVCRGMIRRGSEWQFVCRLKKPLTHEEKLYIRRIKSKAIPYRLPQSFGKFGHGCSKTRDEKEAIVANAEKYIKKYRNMSGPRPQNPGIAVLQK